MLAIQDFFDRATRQLADLPEHDAAALRDRLALARDLVGPLDPLQRLKSWHTPDELLAATPSYL